MCDSAEAGRLPLQVLRDIEKCDVGAVMAWLQSAGTHVDDTESSKQQTGLIWAARKGSTEVMRTLIGAGASLDVQMMAGATAVYVATLGCSAWPR
jgi:hypothetical protein